MKISKIPYQRKRVSTLSVPGLLMALGFQREEVYAPPAGNHHVGRRHQRHLFERLNEWEVLDLAERVRLKFRERLRQVRPDTGENHEESVALTTIWTRLKRIFLKHGIALCLLLSGSAMGGQIPFRFDSTNSSPVNYVIWRVSHAGLRLASATVATNQTGVWTNAAGGFVFTNVPAGTNYFYAVAVTSEGIESESSNSLTLFVPQGPTNLRIGAKIQQGPTPQGPWTELTQVVTVDCEPTEGSQFFRVKSTITQ